MSTRSWLLTDEPTDRQVASDPIGRPPVVANVQRLHRNFGAEIGHTKLPARTA